jgi:hypothetical protein
MTTEGLVSYHFRKWLSYRDIPDESMLAFDLGIENAEEHPRWPDGRRRFVDYEVFEWANQKGRGPVSLDEATAEAVAEIFEPRHRDPILSKLPYEDYLKTPHWLVTRSEALMRAGFQCRRCYAEGVRLDVHHISYERLGRESMDDLIVLCGQCHAAAHRL